MEFSAGDIANVYAIQKDAEATSAILEIEDEANGREVDTLLPIKIFNCLAMFAMVVGWRGVEEWPSHLRRKVRGAFDFNSTS
jgi:hypothetical protein